MQKLQILFFQDVTDVANAVPCNGADLSLCSKVESVYESGNYSFSLPEFQDLPGRHVDVQPVIAAWQISKFPALGFMDLDTNKIFYALDGDKTTKARIKAVFDAAEDLVNFEGLGYVDGSGNPVDPKDFVNSRMGALGGSKFGVPWGVNWGKCSDYLPEVVCKGFSPALSLIVLLIIAFLIYKILK